MKKLIVMIFLSFKILGCQHPQLEVVDMTALHKDAVMEICLQDQHLFFGWRKANRDVPPDESFTECSKRIMNRTFCDSSKIKKVLVCDKKIVAFVDFYKSKEMTLNELKEMMEKYKISFDEKQVVANRPALGRAHSLPEEFIVIGSLAVSKDFRGKGYGRGLLKLALAESKLLWPEIKKARLHVNAFNPTAKKLYESEGFSSLPQLPHEVEFDSLELERAL